jgi:hypothetical protein
MSWNKINNRNNMHSATIIIIRDTLWLNVLRYSCAVSMKTRGIHVIKQVVALSGCIS